MQHAAHVATSIVDAYRDTRNPMMRSAHVASATSAQSSVGEEFQTVAVSTPRMRRLQEAIEFRLSAAKGRRGHRAKVAEAKGFG
jgi:hypothetical protein